MSKLTPKQKRFVEEYLIDCNASAAARRAGYAEANADSEGHRLKNHPEIQPMILAAMEARSQRTGITADRVLNELALLCFSDVSNYQTSDGEVEPAEGQEHNVMRAVASVRSKPQFALDRESGDRVVVGHDVEIRMWNKVEALKLLATHLGMLIERKEHTHKMSWAEMVKKAAEDGGDPEQ